MMYKKILVTGGGGFVGSHVAEYYASKDCEVSILDNFLRAKMLSKGVGNPSYSWNYLKENFGNIKLIEGDIRDHKKIKEAGEGIDAIIHTAAQVAVTTSLTDPMTDFEINSLGTFNVLEVARLNDSALVFCSTNKVYGENVNGIPVKELEKRYEYDDEQYKEGIPENFSIDHTGHSPYGSSKLSADIYVQDYAHTYGLKTGVFRMSCIYGERQFGVEDQGWVAWFVIATLTRKPLTIYGDGKQVRDILYVKDLVKAYDLFLKSKIKHNVYNVGGGPSNTLSLLELIDLIEDITGIRTEIRFADWRPMDQKVYVSDISKIKEELSWMPKVTPKNGVTKLVNWVRETSL